MKGRTGAARAAGLLVGYALDVRLGDPQRHHPVALFGAGAGRLERRLYADTRLAGVGYTGVLVGGTVLGTVLVQRAVRSSAATVSSRDVARTVTEFATVTAATFTALGGTSLVREGDVMARRLESGDLPGARQRLAHLCARDASELGPADLARATVESLAENTSDAVVAPLVWGSLLGAPGLLGYRAANTLDAMVGYRSPRYRNFGWASARFDDLLNLLPARMAALLVFVVTGRRDALVVWRRDAHLHPSPNAGPVEAATAGALGVRLGGTNTYDGEAESRGVLGDGRPVEVADVARANRLSRRVSAAAVVVAAGTALALGTRGPTRDRDPSRARVPDGPARRSLARSSWTRMTA
ncbi:cobalamin biosynthesis protein [Nocardioides jiangxiensis]|uniref:Cobalamin biosynthesis protein CobD n=1 Tax=Nocardioides jiangxiensis TaxID=3064524 RepID=A0ABT9B110_9ACTN|nr:cobalamin biosynthesis protein [Nocardioides sp. WY-20]MDO7868004.1 cobalamin biosynthesis protein [Nocardioides sp. WY-20]